MPVLCKFTYRIPISFLTRIKKAPCWCKECSTTFTGKWSIDIQEKYRCNLMGIGMSWQQIKLEKNGYSHWGNKINTDPYLTPCTKSDLKSIISVTAGPHVTWAERVLRYVRAGQHCLGSPFWLQLITTYNQAAYRCLVTWEF